MTTETTPTYSGPWLNDGLGPRQAKRLQDAVRNLNWQAKAIIEITGTHGDPATQLRHSVVVLGSGSPRADLDEFTKHIPRQVTPKNLQAILDLLAEAVNRMKARPVEVDRRVDPKPAEQIAFEQAEQAARIHKEAERQKAVAECWKTLDARRPSWAKALIIATEKEDTSDMQSDYYGHRDGRKVAIGWRSGSKEDFRQLRTAAAGFPETAHLGPGCAVVKVQARWFADDGSSPDYGDSCPCGYKLDGETFTKRADAEKAIAECGEDMRLTNSTSLTGYEHKPGIVRYQIHEENVEHRDNYSMGHGNWLGTSRNSGWEVTSIDPDSSHTRRTLYEIAIPAATAPAPGGEAITGATGVILSENEERDGYELRFPARPADSILERLRLNGWNWSRSGRCWYHKRTPPAKLVAESIVGGAA